MSTNSKITKSVFQALNQTKAQDELERVRQNADFTLAHDEHLSPAKQINNALDELEHQIKITRMHKKIGRLAASIALAAVIAIICIFIGYVVAEQVLPDPRIIRPLDNYIPITIVLLVLILVLSLEIAFVSQILEDPKKELLLFWAAHANNLLDQYYQEADLVTVQDVEYLTLEALKLIS